MVPELACIPQHQYHAVAHSPDMNIIEHIWATLKHHIRMWNPRPKDLDALWEMVQWEWYHISDGEITHLYD